MMHLGKRKNETTLQLCLFSGVKLKDNVSSETVIKDSHGSLKPAGV